MKNKGERKMMQATDWLGLAKEVLDAAIAVYNSDDKGRRRHVNRLFEAAAKFAHQETNIAHHLPGLIPYHFPYFV